VQRFNDPVTLAEGSDPGGSCLLRGMAGHIELGGRAQVCAGGVGDSPPAGSPTTGSSPPGAVLVRIDRRVRGRPGCRGRDTAAWRRATRSRCQRRTVSGRTSSRRLCSAGFGSRCRSAASHARSAGSSRTRCSPSWRCSTASLVAQGQDLRVLPPVAARQKPQHRGVEEGHIDVTSVLGPEAQSVAFTPRTAAKDAGTAPGVGEGFVADRVEHAHHP
jgi:hypothetical protein